MNKSELIAAVADKAEISKKDTGAVLDAVIMKGCDADSPSCFHTIDDLCDLIKTVGFLPLFSNSIQGFSVEERTTADSWWTGDPHTDPWEWRQIAVANPDIAYGKFFDGKAGFVSRECFPILAN